ncbi:hypothetical protein NQ314_008338, partial [Rhamnusium bicolor]
MTIKSEIDPDEDESDYCEESNDNSDSEEDANEDVEIDEHVPDNDDGVPYYLGKDKVTQWKKACPPKTRTKVHNIFDKKPGPVNNAANAKTIFECFEIFFTEKIIQAVTQSTNIYIDDIKEKYEHDIDAKPTGTCEIRALLGMLYLLGVCKSGRQNITDFWRTDGTGMDVIYCTMSYNRIRFLLRCLRFDDKTTRDERRQTNKLSAIRDVFEMGTYRNITMDNWFSSSQLAIDLKYDLKLTMLGTLRKNKREIPTELVNVANRPEKSCHFAFHKDCTLLSYVPKKKKNILVLSTTHVDDKIDPESEKPMMIVDYNNTKYGADVVDQMCASYILKQKCRLILDIEEASTSTANETDEPKQKNQKVVMGDAIYVHGRRISVLETSVLCVTTFPSALAAVTNIESSGSGGVLHAPLQQLGQASTFPRKYGPVRELRFPPQDSCALSFCKARRVTT